ncbi:MAG: hypothetical protein AB1611_11915 [bacterium]
MRLQSLFGQRISCALVTIFILAICSTYAQAKDNQPSPLFKESLKETLKEFNDGTAKINAGNGLREGNYETKPIEINTSLEINATLPRREVKVEVDKNPLGRKTKVEVDNPSRNREVKIEVDKNPLGREVKVEIEKAGCDKGERFPGRGAFPVLFPTLAGRTCQGVRCYGFPTLAGNTCSTTCGVRSTCSNGRFCRIYPSPCAEADSTDRLAKGGEKSLIFNIF